MLHANRLALLERGNLEKPDTPVLATGDEFLPVRRQRGGIHGLLESLKDHARSDRDRRVAVRRTSPLDRLGYIPNTGSLVEPGGGEERAVAVERHGVDAPGMASGRLMTVGEQLPRLRIVNP